MTILIAALTSVAQAAEFKITPSLRVAGDIRIEKIDADLLDVSHYSSIEKAYPYIGIVSSNQLPSKQKLKNACTNYVRSTLKTPSVAKFASVSDPVYHENAGTYYVFGQVDSQNSYGAMLRGRYSCTMAFEGSEKGGTIYIDVYMPSVK